MLNIYKAMMKLLYNKGSTRSRQNGSGSRLSESGSSHNGSRSSLTRLSDSGGSLNDTVSIIGNAVGHPGAVPIVIYSEEPDGSKEMFSETCTCEDICLSMAHKLGITPTMLNCFSLCLFDVAAKKYYWLAPCQKPGDIIGTSLLSQEQKVHFRMRFMPNQLKCVQLDEVDPDCLTYLMWQVKWDFLHSSLSCFFEESKTDEARGFSCMLILLALRMNSEREKRQENVKAFMKGRNLDHFLPQALRKKMIEKVILGESMIKKVQDLQKNSPAEQYSAHYLKKWCLQVILRQNFDYYKEMFVAYDLDIDEEFERIDGDDEPSQIVDQQELIVVIKMEQSSPDLPRLTVSRKNAKHKNDHIINCYVDSVTKLEFTSVELDGYTWWKLQFFRLDGHRKLLYFKDKLEVYSFVTCVECYYRLVYDFYDSLCQEVEPTRVRELNILRAHGPVRDEFVRKKLKKKNSKHLYVLRSNLKEYGQYDILYLPSTNARLKKETLPKIQSVEGGYIVAGTQDPPQDLKVLVSELIKETNIVSGTCMKIKPQSEGCDELQSLLMGQEPRDLQAEEDERKERKKLENQPKVYCKADLEIQSLLGQGHFTEVYSGLLCGQDEIVVKQLRVNDIQDEDFRIVQEAFHEGLEKLMTLGDLGHFVGYMGMSLVPSVRMVMKGTRYGSLGHFLQVRERGLPMLSLHHLLDAHLQLASALVFMEEKNCYHGNLHCDNISVMNYDNRNMVVRITDPGLVSLYNKLPLDHEVNRKRVPWIAPELQTDLTAVTAESEVYSYGTTLWQMFSQGLNPVDHDVKLKNKTATQIIEYFASGCELSCPQFLRERKEDPDEIKEVKRLLFGVMKSCWVKDPQGRADPKMILRDLNSNVQTYEETYHKYNVIPYYDITSSTASYPVASSSEGTRTQSSRFIYSDQPVLVPDITCLTSVKRKPSESPQRSNRDPARHQQGQNQAPLTTEHVTPAAGGAPVGTQGPQEPSGSKAQSLISPARGAVGGLPTRPLSGLPALPSSSHVIAESRLEIERDNVLGKGHYGAVYKGKLHPTDAMKSLKPDAGPETIVIKVLKPDMVAKYSEDFKKEAQVMETLSHRNVVKFYGICRQGEYLVMEFVENNSLHKYVSSTAKNRQTIPLLIFLKLTVDIASGMEYLEMQKVIHCDLAARNILLSGDLCAKISDFGLSKILSQEKDYYRRTTDKTIPLLWCAPEWIGFEKRFTSKSDVWSFGVVLWEMYSYGKPPLIHKDYSKLYENLHKNERLKQPRNCPDSVYSEMQNCWKWDPAYRPNFMLLKSRFQELCSKEAVTVNDTGPTSVLASTPGSSTVPVSRPGPSALLVSRPGPSATGGGTTKNNQPRQTQTSVVSSPNKSLIEGKNNNTVEKHLQETMNKADSENGPVQPSNIENRLVNNVDVPGELKLEHSPLNQSVRNDSREEQTKQVSAGFQQSSGRDSKMENQNIIIQKKDFSINKKKLLGKGSFGAVYRGKYKGEEVAVKECTDSKQYARFRREFHLLYKLRQKSSNIVHFIGLYENIDTGVGKEHMYVMEYLEGGALWNYLDNRKKEGNPVSIPDKIHFLIDIAKGLDYLFQASIVHCDLTAKNILLSKDLRAKISDFGWAKQLGSEEDNVQYKRDDILLQPFWAAPEVFEHQIYTKFSDIWSYGVVCIEVFQDALTPCLDLPLNKLTGPGEGKNQTGKEDYRKFYRAILKGDRFARPLQCPEEIYNNVLLKCWQKEYDNRILYSKIIEELMRFQELCTSSVDQITIIQKTDLFINKKVLLGKGSFGAVYRGKYRGEEVAVKECTDSQQYARFRREFLLLYKLRQKSSNIVHFIGLYENIDTGVGKEHMYVMEHLEGGALWNYLDNRKKEGNPVSIPDKIHFLIDIAKGMDYLFQASIVHCDLTAKNILLSKDLTAKISDFGWAKELESTADDVSYKREDVLLQPFWAAPEVFQGQIFTKFSDIWSYGVVCIEVFQDALTPCLDLPLNKLTGPGEGKNQTGEEYVKFYRAILKGDRFARPLQCPEEIYNNVLLKCWQQEYKDRILFSNIIEELRRHDRTSLTRNEIDDA